MKCNNCKAFIPDKSVFCPFCGRKTENKITQIILDRKSIIIASVIFLVILAGLFAIIFQGNNNVSESKAYMADFTEAEISLSVGDEYPLSITTGVSSSYGEYAFVSSDESVVGVNGNLIFAKSAGTASVALFYGDQCCNRCLVTVTDIQPTEFSINPMSQNNLIAKIGRPYDPPFTFSPENTTDTSVNYLIADPEIAVVQDGHIVGLSAGKTTVYAIHKSTGLSTTFQVSFESVALEEIYINIPTLLNVGDTVMLNCTFEPSDASDKTVSWSTNSDCVTISGELLTAKKRGTAVICATCPGGIQDNIVIQIF